MDRLDAFAIFASVAEHASFAEAARRLKRTPASVTRAVADLEAHLRARLFNRTTRSVSLTEAGEQHLGIVRRLLADYAELRAIEPDGGGQPRGTLRVTAPTHFGRLHLGPLLAKFLERHPAVDIDLLLVDRIISLVEEGLDVGVRLGELPDSTLRATRSGSVRLGLYASPSYLERRGTPMSPHELAMHDVVASTVTTPTPDRWSLAAGSSVAVRPRLVVNTTEAAAEVATSGLGIVRLVSYQAAPLIEDGRLVQLALGHDGPVIPIYLVQPAGPFTPAKVRLFVAEIGDALRRRFPDTA